jgi:hypothetical protein
MAKAPKAPPVDPNIATIDKYKALGLTDAANYVTKGKFDEAKAQTDLIKNVYKLDPAAYTDKNGINLDKATAKYQFELPKIAVADKSPESFTQAVTNYSNYLSQAQKAGVANLNAKDQQALKDAAKIVRDFDSKNLSVDAKEIIKNITGGTDLIDQLNNKNAEIQAQKILSTGKDADGKKVTKLIREGASQKVITLQEEVRALSNQINQGSPRLVESLSRYGLSDLGVSAASNANVGKLSTGLQALSGDAMFDTGGLAGKLNIQVTDDQILNDINTARKNKYKELYDIGTAAITDLQSRLDQGNKFLADLPANDRRRTQTQKDVDSIASELATAQKDTLEAKRLYDGYQPISGDKATTALSQVREKLRLPEERTLEQIDIIDPTTGASIRSLADQYKKMIETPLAPTTSPETEAFRKDVEQRIAGQVALGSQLGAEEQRQYQQAARGAQAARGNIFGVAPAVEEAVTTGLAGEQRLQARLGAAQGFLSSGQTVSDALARDASLRNALDQSRLGAAQGFIASGPTAYNMASQRLGTQQAMLNNYLAASQPQGTGGFTSTPSTANPYGYLNPNAGFVGAQNAASIYNTLADSEAKKYGAYVQAQASRPTGAQQFAQIAGGIGSLMPSFAFGA